MDPLSRPVQALKWRRKRTPLSQEIKSGYRILATALLILGISSTSTYLYLNSLKPAKGYTLKQLQMETEALESDFRKLDHKVIEAQSFLNIEGSEVLKRMEAAAKEVYSYVDDSSVASNTQ